MCEHDPRLTSIPGRCTGSRRRRLWELGPHAHCPVVGVCLPIGSLRRLIGKLAGGTVIADDYELHCGVIAECKHRSPMAEALQRELDRRYAIALRQAAKAKSSDALAQWWLARADSDVAGALWATLTHARCDAALEERVLRDIHMLQHQVGAADRADLRRLHALMDENAVLARELAAAQQRATQLASTQGRKVEQLQAQAMQLRAELIGRDTALAALGDDLRALEAAVPGLKSRADLARVIEQQAARIHDIERALLRAQHDGERACRRAEAAEQALNEIKAPAARADEVPALPRLDDRAVLCVGGRQASVPVYRKLIERVGARFLHHDGGHEDGTSQLDATLDSADLVICQTGCISHDAYWRVKDHCKRTGKRCVFVEKPSRASLQRALSALATATRAPVITLVPASTDSNQRGEA
jgi:hypothetical protein